MVVQDYKEVKQVFKENLEKNVQARDVDYGSYGTYRVLQYLPITGKANLLQYVINGAMDAETGCFSPIRIEVYYAIGILKSYCGVHIDEDVSITDLYDEIVCCGLLDAIKNAIPETEKTFMNKLICDTISDITRYNNSFASVVQSMSQNSSDLNNSIEEILKNIKNGEGLEVLSEIKNVVGTD